MVYIMVYTRRGSRAVGRSVLNEDNGLVFVASYSAETACTAEVVQSPVAVRLGSEITPTLLLAMQQ